MKGGSHKNLKFVAKTNEVPVPERDEDGKKLLRKSTKRIGGASKGGDGEGV